MGQEYGPGPEDIGIRKMDEILSSTDGEPDVDELEVDKADGTASGGFSRRTLVKGVGATVAAGMFMSDTVTEGAPDSQDATSSPDAMSEENAMLEDESAESEVVVDAEPIAEHQTVEVDQEFEVDAEKTELQELHESMVMELPDIDETTIHQRYAPGLPANQTSAAENALEIYPNPDGYIQVEYQFEDIEADYFVFYLTEADYTSKPGRGIPVDANGGKVEFSTFPEMQSLFNNGEYQGYMVRAVLVEDGKHLSLASSNPRFENPEAIVSISYEDLSETQPVESADESLSEAQPVESAEEVQSSTPESDDPLAGDRIKEVGSNEPTAGGNDGGGFPYAKAAGAGAGAIGIGAAVRKFFGRGKGSQEKDVDNVNSANLLASEKQADSKGMYKENNSNPESSELQQDK